MGIAIAPGIARPGCAWSKAIACLAVFAALAFSPAPASAKITAKKGIHGAIALHRESGRYGYAVNATTSRAARAEALQQCAHARCEVMIAFSKSCAALARGPAKHFTATGATRDEAEAKSLRRCTSPDCEIVAWACTK